MTQSIWSNKDKLGALLRMPWTLLFGTDEHDGTLTAQVAELPDAIAVGKDERELSRALYGAIEASLSSRLEHGDPIQLPPRSVFPWNDDKAETPRYRRFTIRHDMAFPHEAAAKLEATESTSNTVDLAEACV
jgi:predicted RNase H-like HicB family nuclease